MVKKVLNFGSLNIDFVYSLDHIVQPGETITSQKLEVFPGGKGLNQSVALARAGARVFHAGMIGGDGGMLLEVCRESGVDTHLIRTVQERTGNAVIQVSAKGQNSIVLFGGANRANTRGFVDEVLSEFEAGDLLLLQNEINQLGYIIDRAQEKGMRLALNPSPFDAALQACDLSKINLFLLNEVECFQLTGERDPQKGLKRMSGLFPEAEIVLTLGKEGVIYQKGDEQYRHGIYRVPVVDTTAAGDTFTGYFIASVLAQRPAQEALRIASVASSLAVSRKGASCSIPALHEVLAASLQPA